MTLWAVTFPGRSKRSLSSMAEVRPARKRAALPGRVTAVISYRVMLVAAGILLAALLAAFVPLTMASHDLHQSADATAPVMAVALAAVGLVVASRQPRNPIGWLLCGSGLASMLSTDAELYVVLDYRIDHGTLPLGPAAALWVWAFWQLAFLIGTPCSCCSQTAGCPPACHGGRCGSISLPARCGWQARWSGASMPSPATRSISYI